MTRPATDEIPPFKRFHSLFFKITATFLAVIAVSLVLGTGAFLLVVDRPANRIHRDTTASIARMSARIMEEELARGSGPDQVGRRLQETYQDFPYLTVLYRPPSGPVRGKLEPGHEELRQLLEGATAAPVPPPRFLGPGRGFVVIHTVGPDGSQGLGLVSAHGPIEAVQSAFLRSLAAALSVFVLVAAGLGLLVTRRLSDRLGRVREAMAAVALGDLSPRILDSSPDEIGALGRSFNRMADQLAQAREKAGEEERKRRQLLADLSHELKTPLTTVRGCLETVMGPGTPSPGPLPVAFEEVDRMGLLIEDLMELARIDSGELVLKREDEVLQRLVQRSAGRMEVALANRKIRLETGFPPEPVRAPVDVRRLEQVVLNLIQNAINSMEEGGTLRLTVAGSGSQATIAVEDTGRGLTPAERERVFDRFYTGQPDRGGTGLGLSIVKRLVEAHSGEIVMESSPGVGTRVTLRLPAAGA